MIDHSVQVDQFATPQSLQFNVEKEFERNIERYQFLRWGQQAFNNFRVVPPATGIVHQVNLEFLAKVVLTRDGVAFPDTLVGTDSHTTMINGLGVVGWGVGGIEAEAVMLGQPLYMLTPEVVGFKVAGELREGVTATDLVLTVTQMLRKQGVVGKFVEFYGPGLDAMSSARPGDDRQHGARIRGHDGLLSRRPGDARYLKRTGRTADEVDLVERYYKEQGLFRTSASPEPRFSSTLSLDLATVEASMAGPKRPQDRVLLKDMKSQWQKDLVGAFGKSAPAQPGPGEAQRRLGRDYRRSRGDRGHHELHEHQQSVGDGRRRAAGAERRRRRDCKPKPWVKTSLAPGSRVVTDYLEASGARQAARRSSASISSATAARRASATADRCPMPVSQGGRAKGDLVAAAVLSGNRNFEGRINPQVKANYLASPPLVVAYALAGTTDIDLVQRAVGQRQRRQGRLPEGHLADAERDRRHDRRLDVSRDLQERIRQGDARARPSGRRFPAATGELYQWDAKSTYVQEPPFFVDMPDDAARRSRRFPVRACWPRWAIR